jgi:hypothetical protein
MQPGPVQKAELNLLRGIGECLNKVESLLPLLALVFALRALRWAL